MKKALSILLVLFFLASTTNAQFEVGKSHAGPSIGFPFGGAAFGGSSIIFGANYEYGAKIEDIPGLIGYGGHFRYWNWGSNVGLLIFGAQANYHFRIGDGKIDPFVGLSVSYVTITGTGTSIYGGIGGGLIAGARYWFSPKMGATIRFGSSYGAGIDFGVDFKF